MVFGNGLILKVVGVIDEDDFMKEDSEVKDKIDEFADCLCEISEHANVSFVVDPEEDSYYEICIGDGTCGESYYEFTISETDTNFLFNGYITAGNRSPIEWFYGFETIEDLKITLKYACERLSNIFGFDAFANDWRSAFNATFN